MDVTEMFEKAGVATYELKPEKEESVELVKDDTLDKRLAALEAL